MNLPTLALLLLSLASYGSDVNAQQTADFPAANAAVRVYQEHHTNSVDFTTEPLAFAQAETEEHERATLGSPAIVAIVIGCVAVVALAIAAAYRARNPPEPMTPREDLSGVTVVSTKSMDTDYQQSYDRLKKAKAKARVLEPHSPKMPPPPVHHTTPSTSAASSMHPPPPQRMFAPHSPTHSPREGEAVVVAM